jgi:signal transduction histidine kinase
MPKIQAAESEFRRRFWWAISMPLVLMALLLSLFVFQTNRLNSSLQAMARSNTVLVHTARLRRAIVDAESDAQQYLLSRDASLLQRYQADQSHIPSIVDDLAKARSVQDPRTDTVSQTYQRWRAQMDQAIQSPQYDVRRATEDRAQWNALLRSIDDVIDNQIADRAQNAAAAESSVHRGVRFGVGLAIILAILITLFTREQLKEIASRYRIAVEDANEKKAAAERALASRDDFFSIASHELKTPITTMELRAHALQSTLNRTPLPPSSRAAVNAAMRSVGRQLQRLSDLIESILDVTQLNTGHLKLNISEAPISVEKVIQKGVNSARELLEQANCQVDLKLEPADAQGWDEDRISQALKALLSNSAKYAPSSTIEIRSSIADDHVQIEITDHGLGIATKDHPRIFRLFERGVSSRHYGGLGTGLYITREIIEAHQGTIRVVSHEGSGATVIIDLPLHSEIGRAVA